MVPGTYLAAVDASFLVPGAEVVVMDPAVVPVAAVAPLERDEVHAGLLQDVGRLGGL